jgi:hypothetical protein
VHAHHAERERMRGGEGAEAEQREATGSAALGEVRTCSGAGFDDAVAGEDDGRLALLDELDGCAMGRSLRRGSMGCGR